MDPGARCSQGGSHGEPVDPSARQPLPRVGPLPRQGLLRHYGKKVTRRLKENLGADRLLHEGGRVAGERYEPPMMAMVGR